MKLTYLLLFLSFLQVSATGFAQKITLHEKNAPLEKVLKKIRTQSGFDLVYSVSSIENAKPVSVDIKNADLKDALDVCFTNQPYTYLLDTRTIVVKLKDAPQSNNKQETPPKPVTVTGKVTDTTGTPLVGATVHIKGLPNSTLVGNDGLFTITAQNGDEITISFIGYEPYDFTITESTSFMQITLHQSYNKLDEVQISTGYQTLPQERATGAFTIIDNKTFNRAVSPDLLSRLKGVTNGLLFDNKTGNPTGISVRGRSTIFSDTKPLIVVDNFPFEGDINTLNPNDIEHITLLKDAAAASIWGVRAGNGVIVITTKGGKLNQKPVVSFNTNVTVGGKPNLKYQPQLTSSEFIDVEQYLFNNGKYTSTLRRNYALISPVVAILQQQKLNQLTADQAKQQLDALRNIDVRDQQSEYFYRKSTRQQYHLDISGGGPSQTYYFSGGYDKNLPTDVASSDSRITLKGNNTYSLLNDHLKLTTDITFSKSKTANNNAYGYNPLYPYEQPADADGNPLPTLVIGGLRASYTDTAGNGNLLDWKYRPLDELRSQNSTSKTDLTDYRILLGLNYKFIKPLTVSLNYQYYNSNQKGEISFNQQSFYTRNLINTASQINSSTGYITRPIPIGDIYTPSFNISQSNYGRAQLNFNQTYALKHDVSAIAGYEIRDDKAQFNSTTLYGYFPETATNTLVDFLTVFPSYYGPGATVVQLGKNNSQSAYTNRYISYYGNASYMYDGKYVVSGSYRKDESNLFGVKANQKGVPLWSTGIAWNINKEDFFNLSWLSRLQLKATYGYNGNVNQTVSAYLTANAAGASPLYGSNYASIINPPNDALKWERVKNMNTGFDFSSKNNRISGSLEYYIKNGMDLIGTSPIAPQTGVSTFTGNSADTHTNGIDLQINSINIDGQFKWMTTGIFNYVKDRVTEYKAQKGTNQNLVAATSLTPLAGYPINSIFGFKWSGLDNTGAPQGYLNGVQSKDYTAILNAVNPDELAFFGSAVPNIFGSLRNSFSYKNIELSFNITYKLNYYFRRNSLNYATLFSGNYQQADYEQRWQKAGDELTTNVPSVLYPIDNNRNEFYRLSSVLVEKGDHIRLQDIQVNYTFTKAKFKALPFSNLNIYLYASNLGILWRANQHNLDPDVRSGYPNPKTIAFGLNTTF